MEQPDTRYVVRPDGASIAYQTWGSGSTDLLYSPGFVSHLDLLWADPGYERFFSRLGSIARVIAFDKLGTGCSDQMTVDFFAPSAAGRFQRRLAAVFERAAASPGMIAGLVEVVERVDIRDILAGIRVPTLVLHRSGDTVPVEAGRELAELIPGARFVEGGPRLLVRRLHFDRGGDRTVHRPAGSPVRSSSARSPRFSSPTSSTPPGSPAASATASGARSWSGTTRSSARRSSAMAAAS